MFIHSDEVCKGDGERGKEMKEIRGSGWLGNECM